MVCENASSGLGLKVGPGYYGRRIDQPIVMNSAWSGPIKRGVSTSLSEEVTRPSLKKAGHVIDHFARKIKLHLDCNFVSALWASFMSCS
jgi:hypothetical protein